MNNKIEIQNRRLQVVAEAIQHIHQMSTKEPRKLSHKMKKLKQVQQDVIIEVGQKKQKTDASCEDKNVYIIEDGIEDEKLSSFIQKNSSINKKKPKLLTKIKQEKI